LNGFYGWILGGWFYGCIVRWLDGFYGCIVELLLLLNGWMVLMDGFWVDGFMVYC